MTVEVSLISTQVKQLEIWYIILTYEGARPGVERLNNTKAVVERNTKMQVVDEEGLQM